MENLTDLLVLAFVVLVVWLSYRIKVRQPESLKQALQPRYPMDLQLYDAGIAFEKLVNQLEAALSRNEQLSNSQKHALIVLNSEQRHAFVSVLWHVDRLRNLHDTSREDALKQEINETRTAFQAAIDHALEVMQQQSATTVKFEALSEENNYERLVVALSGLVQRLNDTDTDFQTIRNTKRFGTWW
jgi:hypothetical protein